MAKMNQTAKAVMPAREQSEMREPCIEIIKQGFAIEKTEHTEQDERLAGAVLESLAKVVTKDWPHMAKAANERSEGEVVVTLRVNVPFGLPSDKQEVHTMVSFGGMKFRDEDKVKVEDASQMKLAGLES